MSFDDMESYSYYEDGDDGEGDEREVDDGEGEGEEDDLMDDSPL